MNKPTRYSFRALLAGAALVGGAVAGVVGAAAASSGDQPNNELRMEVKYERNQANQTYGSSFDAVSAEAEPDLIEAMSSDGKIGYVKKTDLNDKMASSPDEAMRQEQARSSREIPVYAVDGETVIGTFVVEAGSDIDEG